MGGLAGIESHGLVPSHGCGTSAGAIVAALRIAGYSPNELKNLLDQTDFLKFLDGNGWGRKIWNITTKKGIYKGDAFYQYMYRKLADKGVIFFKDLLTSTVRDLDNPKYRWRFKCYSADITKNRLVTWPDDASLYGLDPDYLEVAWAVRTSMSIPLFFEPVQKAGSYLVDGGLLSNFPIWQWDDNRNPDWPTFGLLLDESPGSEKINKINKWPHSFVLALMHTMLNAHDRRFIRPEDFTYRTIRIPITGVHTTDFDIVQEKKDYLYHVGLSSAMDFLQTWSFEDYYAWASGLRGKNIV